MKIVIIGGTGLIGTKLASRLREKRPRRAASLSQHGPSTRSRARGLDRGAYRCRDRGGCREFPHPLKGPCSPRVLRYIEAAIFSRQRPTAKVRHHVALFRRWDRPPTAMRLFSRQAGTGEPDPTVRQFHTLSYAPLNFSSSSAASSRPRQIVRLPGYHPPCFSRWPRTDRRSHPR